MGADAETDHRAIENLLGRYCQAVAAFDATAWADTWADDARWEVSGGEPVYGRQSIVEIYGRVRARFDLCVQQLTGTVIEVAGDRATGWAQIRELQWRPDGTTTELLGEYHDEYVRTPDGWRFAVRSFVALARGPVELPPVLPRAAAEPPVDA